MKPIIYCILFNLIIAKATTAQFTDITPPGIFEQWINVHVSDNDEIFLLSSDSTFTALRLWIYTDSLTHLTDEVQQVTLQRELTNGNVLFIIKDSMGMESLQLYEGDSLRKLTPNYLDINQAIVDDTGEIVFFTDEDSTSIKSVYYGIVGGPFNEISPPGNYISFQYLYKNAAGHIFLEGREDLTLEKHLFYYNGIFTKNLNVPEDNGVAVSFESQSGLTYFSAFETSPVYRALYRTDGNKIFNVTPDSNNYFLIIFFPNEDEHDRLFWIQDDLGNRRAYRIVGSTNVVENVTPSGLWHEIDHLHENFVNNHNDFITFKRNSSDSMFLYRIGSNVVDLNGGRYWTDIQYVTNCQDDEIFYVQNGDTGLYELYKNENGIMVQFLNLGFDQLVRGLDTLTNGNLPYFLKVANSQQYRFTTCLGNVLVDRTPVGAWSDIQYIGIDGNNLMYFSMDDDNNADNAKLFAWNGQLYRSIELPGQWTEHRKLLFHDSGTSYFSSRVSHSDATILAFDGDSSFIPEWLDSTYGESIFLNPWNETKSFLAGPIPNDTSDHHIFEITESGGFDVTPIGNWTEFRELKGKVDGTTLYQFREEDQLSKIWRFDNLPKNDPCNSGHIFAYEEALSDGTYQAHQYLYSEGQIPPFGNVNFKASQGILIRPGFEIGEDSEMSMEIDTCPD